MTTGCKKAISSSIHRFAKRAVSIAASDELSRKKIVSSYYEARFRLGNLRRAVPDHTAEELLSWKRTMNAKVEYAREVYRGNSFYGAGRAMREYANVSTSLKACIEHGLYLGSYTNPLELDDSGLPAVVTYGPVRARHIHDSSGTPILTVGPYIAYAESYLSEVQMMRAKRMLGRTLLAFPSHSIDYVEKRFDTPSYIEHLKARAKDEDMDTVLVSLYFTDILSGAAELYERVGFKVVTNGYREDSNFLCRLRSLILLADGTSSNSMGTHIGYCAYFGKAHHVFRQELVAAGATKLDDECIVATNFSANGVEEGREITEAFAVPSSEITDQQLGVCDKYWGFGCVKSREELARYFDLLERASAQGGHRLSCATAESLEAMTLSSLDHHKSSANSISKGFVS